VKRGDRQRVEEGEGVKVAVEPEQQLQQAGGRRRTTSAE
jgi:hypothetical protein